MVAAAIHRRVRRAAMASVAVAMLTLSAQGVAAQPMPMERRQGMDGPMPMRDAPASFAALAKSKLPAVVTITAAATERRGPQAGPQGRPGPNEPGQAPPPNPFPPGSPFEDFLEDFFGRGGPDTPQPRPTRAVGSGFIVDAAGFIVTNNHVVEDATEIEVTLQGGDTLAAKVVGTDPATDIAVLKVEPRMPLPTLAWGDSDRSEVGDWVIAIGNPFGLGGTVTSGIISARARDIGAGNYDDFLQTDAAINTGNSGGPLIAMDGSVIGVNTAIFSRTGGSIGIGFAVPSGIARKVTAELRDKGFVTRGFLGVTIQQVTPEIAGALGLEGEKGALVSGVAPDSPAARAGLAVGDVVLTLDGRPVERPRDLSRAVADIEPGARVELGVLRDGRRETVTAQVGELPRADRVAAAPAPTQTEGEGALGLALAPMTPAIREKFALQVDVQGVVVTAVAPGSPAAERGFQPGDVITRANSTVLESPADLARTIDRAKGEGKDSIVVLRRTRQGAIFVPIPIDRQAG